MRPGPPWWARRLVPEHDDGGCLSQSPDIARSRIIWPDTSSGCSVVRPMKLARAG